ncbi:ornithine carbamoyltransferase [Gelria sp. Kuro-4]|uniref:ornithine carbamoyltransferase n=1 Tax=Gelria sp. Kuro-4 TaxID=2796927 RepID=UPI001BEEA78C|nr:ornithine carbamoyltransferase [Gelria sp. Kuro-4]BCV24166.1 ornithine carbamoyltransferase [Gelria sp. Kuro-4]
MKNNFKGRDFLSLMDFTREEVYELLDLAVELKRRHAIGDDPKPLQGRTIAMIFEKNSTRTRLSFQAGIAQLGGQSFYMRPDEMQLNRGEPIKDTARVIDRYCDALVIRTFGKERVEEFAHYMKNPVINALTDQEHPCQILADLMTIREKKGRLEGLKLTFAADLFNMAHSLLIACPLMGIDIAIAHPEGLKADPKIVEFAEETARKNGTKVVLTTDMSEALRDADVIYANTYHSMGTTEEERKQREAIFFPYRIDEEKVKVAKDDFIFLHCLPAYREEEMTESILEGPHSVVWDEAENRMHTEKAVLAAVVY